MEQNYNVNDWTEPCPKYDCRKAACKCGLKYVNIPMSLGDDSAESSVAPKNGAYCNALVFYEANEHVYIYTQEGVPTLIDVDASDISTLEQEVIKAQRDVHELREDIDDFIYGFNTVADMKNAANLSSGDIVRTLGYYAKDDGGGAYYKILSSQPNTYYETLGNLLYAELIVEVANVKQFGAKGDGVTDDAPKIRNAIAYLKVTGNKKLYFPVGIYYVNSGDPRGLNGQGIFSNGDYYTCFELLPNMEIYGDGEGSKILYNSNRLGYNLNTQKGDVGAIFANFRVNGVENYKVDGTVEIRDLLIEYTKLSEENIRDYIDGQIIRANTSNPSQTDSWAQNYNGDFIFTNLHVENCPGHQIFNVTGAKTVNVNNVQVHNIGTMLNTKNLDHSCFFINSQVCNIYNSGVICDERSSGTAYELHATNGELYGCYTKNNGTFVNLVGNVNGYPSTYNVHDNIVEDVVNFTNEYIYSFRYVDTINIYNNDVTLRYDTDKTTEHLMRIVTENGPTGVENPVKNLNFYDNDCKTSMVSDIEVYETTRYNYAIQLQMFENLSIVRNKINNFRRGFIYASENADIQVGTIKNIYINDNEISNIGLLEPADFQMPVIAVVMHVNFGRNYIDKNINIESNFIDIRSRGDSSTGITFNYRAEIDDEKTKARIVDNTILGCDEEIRIISSAYGRVMRGIMFKHHYATPITSVIQALLSGNNASTISFENGSCISASLYDNLAEAEIIGEDKVKQTIYVDDAEPAFGGYFRNGSIAYNTNPSYTDASPWAWICTTAGTAGSTAVWKPLNPKMS